MNNLKKTLVVNLFAGPRAGKSTVMADIFSRLKRKGIDCEMTGEYAKEKVWEDTTKILLDQFYVSAKQYHRLHRLNGKVDVIISDSPLLLGLYYGDLSEPEEFKSLIVKKFNEFDNLNIFLERNSPYNPNGRMQDEKTAKDIDKFLREEVIPKYCPNAIHIPAERESINKIVEIIESKIEVLNEMTNAENLE